MSFPDRFHIITYDVRGTVVHTGHPKPCRQSGLVVHTHQFLRELTRRHPTTRLAITQTGAPTGRAYQVRTPDGHRALVQGIQTGFPQYLRATSAPGKDPALVHHFYEERIDQVNNPVYRSLARQYARVIARAAAGDILAQNINPIIGILKAEEFGTLRGVGAEPLGLTGVIHDVTGADQRFDYLRRRLADTRHRLHLIAVSDAVRERLLAVGLPTWSLTTVPNGLDVDNFQQRLHAARTSRVFETVRRRNRLPETGPMILMSARRVRWKGHLDLIAAAAALADRDTLGGYVVMNGHDMLDSRDGCYDDELHEAIHARGLTGRVFLLDALNPAEVAACYAHAAVAVLPSRQPEAFGYANIEAMLAGAAVITSNHGGPRDYLTDGVCGLLVPPNDPAALADALGRLISDPALCDRLAAAGQQRAAAYTAEAMFTRYAQIITAARAVTA